MPEQDRLIDRVLAELATTLHAAAPEELARFRGMVRAAPRVFVAGRGRSGLAMSGFAMRLMHLGLTAHVVGDMTTPAIRAGDLLVIGSGSGRTASLVQYALRAHELGAPIALFTIAEQSPIGDLAAFTLRIPAPTPKLAEIYDPAASVLPMGSLFEHTLGLLLDLVVAGLMDELNLTTAQMFTRHANLE